jgi:hypothetical protein
MKINCLSCGHSVDLGPAYDDYKGRVKCYACHAMLEIQTEDGQLKQVRLPHEAVEPATREAAVHTP